jgi:outer membrane protein OmpA-like peptidoglycan-associated protein
MLLVLGATVQQDRLREERGRPGEEGSRSPEGNGTLPHDQPPIVVLTEAEGYSFETGKAEITPEFAIALNTQIIARLKTLARQYECDVIEVIGHTDGQPVAARSNLDTTLTRVISGQTFALTPGSNADLGLMRAWSVIRHLQGLGEFQRMLFYGYSAGQVIRLDGSYAAPHDVTADATRRRIEIRLRRSPSSVHQLEGQSHKLD